MASSNSSTAGSSNSANTVRIRRHKVHEQYEIEDAEKDVLEAAKYLRSGEGVPVLESVCEGKRVFYFQGKQAVEALLKPGYHHASRRAVTNQREALALLTELYHHSFFIRADQVNPKMLKVTPVSPSTSPEFSEEGFYVWLYEGSQWRTVVLGLAIVAVVLVCVMFPLWPAPAQVGVWYLSVGLMGFIGLFFLMSIMRTIVYYATIILNVKGGAGFLLFPNLFEDVSVIDSFKPVYAWDMPASMSRSAAAVSDGVSSAFASSK